MKLLPIITLLINLCISYEPLLKQITRLYPQNAFLDDINSIAIDQDNDNIYVTNTASGTIDIISYSSIIEGHFEQSLTIIRSIDINLQGSPHFKLDYITSITYTIKGYIVATLIPYNYAKLPGWLVFIDPDTQYIENFIPLKYCYSPKHIVPTSDGKKLVIACEGLADPHVADPAGSISVVNIESNDPTQWKIYNVGFTAYDDCEDSYDEELVMKHLPEGIYLPEPTEVFSINAEPEYITIDDNDRFAYISLQENNGVVRLGDNFGFGACEFGSTEEDKDNGIIVIIGHDVYGLRQPEENGDVFLLAFCSIIMSKTHSFNRYIIAPLILPIRIVRSEAMKRSKLSHQLQFDPHSNPINKQFDGRDLPQMRIGCFIFSKNHGKVCLANHFLNLDCNGAFTVCQDDICEEMEAMPSCKSFENENKINWFTICSESEDFNLMWKNNGLQEILYVQKVGCMVFVYKVDNEYIDEWEKMVRYAGEILVVVAACWGIIMRVRLCLQTYLPRDD